MSWAPQQQWWLVGAFYFLTLALVSSGDSQRGIFQLMAWMRSF
jgi:hypothetical protein